MKILSRLPRRVAGALAVAAVAAATTAGLLGASTAPASASSGFSVRFAPLSNPFLNVEVRGASTNPGATVDQWSFNGGANQVWTFQPSGSHYQVVNRQSGLCLTSDGVAGDTLYQDYCRSGATLQLWDTNLVPGNLTSYTIQNAGSGLYMDVRGGAGWQGADIITWYFNNGYNQYYSATWA
jgi:hypothetical protein